MRIVFLGCFLFLFMVAGCAVNTNTANNNKVEAPWEKEVLIEFRTNATALQKEQFYDINRLEFLSQYNSDTVKCKIISGETVTDLVDRLSNDPLLTKIERFDPNKTGL